MIPTITLLFIIYAFTVVVYDYCADALISRSILFVAKNRVVDNETRLFNTRGFGNGGEKTGSKKKQKGNKRSSKKSQRLVSSLLVDDDRPRQPSNKTSQQPYMKSKQNDLIEELASKSSKTSIGQSVIEAQDALRKIGTTNIDPFWELMPSLIQSRFPTIKDNELERIAGMVKFSIHPDSQSLLDQNIVDDPWRPHDEIHAYMPNLGETKPFWDTNELHICQQLSDNYVKICEEYEALLQDRKDRFQSVTSMNYDQGWKTLVLFYNGHRIEGFPYEKCPVTTKLMESLPLAGRIAGFNRQSPSSGIPLHSDGNNMWLTLQMGIRVPKDENAWIRVGPDRNFWKDGECIVYDTTYEHETKNESESEERVVLHIDFFNTLKMTPVEIEVMQYIYSLREEFMKAEGVSKVGKQIL